MKNIIKKFTLLGVLLLYIPTMMYATTSVETRKIPLIQVSSVWDFDHLKHVKQQLNSTAYKTAYHYLIAQSDSLLHLPALSVIMKNKMPASGDKHDYMSIARYAWPDPSKPNGLPYKNRDGRVNPEIFDYDRYNLGVTAERIVNLSLAWYFSNEEKYAKKATELIRVWFLNKATRMNPNLEYSQVVRGQNNDKGRSVGLIDTYSFIEMLEGVSLLEKSHSFTLEDSQALKQWFATLTEWMLTSPQGKEESRRANNHSCSYDAQVIAFSLYAGKKQQAMEIRDRFFEKRLFKQVEPDGRQPLELARTLAFHYSRENITHFVNICLLSKRLGMAVDRRESADGRSLYKAVDFLLPYVGKKSSEWPYKQLTGWDDEVQSFCKDLCRIANFLNPVRQKDYLNIYNKFFNVNVKERFNLLYVK